MWRVTEFFIESKCVADGKGLRNFDLYYRSVLLNIMAEGIIDEQEFTNSSNFSVNCLLLKHTF